MATIDEIVQQVNSTLQEQRYDTLKEYNKN